MKIRQAKTEDLSFIKNLIKKYPTKLIQTNLPRVRDFVVAVEKGEVVGCCALEVYSKRLAEIRSLVVQENFQRQGVANKMIGACLNRARKLKIREILSVTGAVELFKKQGFKTFNQEKYAMLKMME